MDLHLGLVMVVCLRLGWFEVWVCGLEVVESGQDGRFVLD